MDPPRKGRELATSTVTPARFLVSGLLFSRSSIPPPSTPAPRTTGQPGGPSSQVLYHGASLGPPRGLTLRWGQYGGCGLVLPRVLLTFSAWGPGGPGAPTLPGNPGGPCVNKAASRNQRGARMGVGHLPTLLYYDHKALEVARNIPPASHPRNTASACPLGPPRRVCSLGPGSWNGA